MSPDRLIVLQRVLSQLPASCVHCCLPNVHAFFEIYTCTKCTYMLHVHININNIFLCIIYIYTSSTAQGGGGSFKNRKPIGEVGCCESGMAERIHWWTERCLISLTLSLSFSAYLPTYLSIFYVSIQLSIYLSISLSLSFICLSVYLSTCLSMVQCHPV